MKTPVGLAALTLTSFPKAHMIKTNFENFKNYISKAFVFLCFFTFINIQEKKVVSSARERKRNEKERGSTGKGNSNLVLALHFI